MKSKHLLLTLLLALLVPWAANAQETLTVYDQGGTTNNGYVPMYGGYFDDYTKSEFIIPAAKLNDMAGGTITSMKFYIYSVSTYGSGWDNTHQVVFLKEVEATTTTLSAWSGTDGATIVFDGTFTVPASTDTEFEIIFTEPYEYNGGSLIVGVYNTDDGSYRTVNWYGESVTGASGGNSNGSSLDGVTFSQKNFIPKTTFTYEPASSDCPNPKTLVASDVTAHGATMTWTMEDETAEYQFNLEYKKTTEEEWTRIGLGNVRTYPLPGLDAETEYQVRIQTACDPENDKWKNLNPNFTTEVACPAPTNLAVDPNSITAYEATATWEGTSESYVVSLGVYDFTATPTLINVEEGFESTDMPTGWTHIGSGSAAPNSPSSSHVHSGKAMRFSGATSNNVVVLPEFEVEANMLTIDFWSKAESTSASYSGEFDLGYVTDATSASTFVALETYYAADHGSAYVHIENYSMAAVPAGARIAFRHRSGSTSWYWFIDDVTISGNVYPINWTEYTTTNQSYPFPSLTPNTPYQVKVKGNCGDEGYSQEAGPVSFTTLPSCFDPTGLTMVEGYPTAHGVSFTWDYEDGEVFQFALVQGNLTEIADADFNTVWNAGDNFPMWSTLSADTDWSFFLRKKCGDTDFSKAVYANFHTLEACPAPTGFAVVPNSITAHTADLTWEGTSDSYQVAYRTVAYVDGIEQDFTNNPTGWLFRTGALNADGTATLTETSSWSRGNSNNVFDSHIYMNLYIYGGSLNYWLITPSMEIKDGDALSFDMAYTPYSNNNPLATGCETHRFAVLISTDNMEHWTILREWNNSGSEYVLDEVSNTGQNSGNISLTTYVGQTVYIAFFGHAETTSYDNNFHFDNVQIGTPVEAGEWQYKTNVTEVPCQLTGLLAERKYEATLQGDCGNEGVSTVVGPINFTTGIACPAPTALSHANVKSNQVDLSWTNGGAENWVLAYKKTADAEFTELPLGLNDVTIEGTTVNYTLAGLTEETPYTVKVRDNCELTVAGDGQSAWTSPVSFTTMAACAVSNVAVSNIGHFTATVNWDGESNNGYTVKYREAAGIDVQFFEGFEDETEFDSWNAFGNANTTNSYFGRKTAAKKTDNYGFSFNSWNNATDYNQYLVSPKLTVSGILTFQYKCSSSNSSGESFRVGLSSTDSELESFTWGEVTTTEDTDWHEYTYNIPEGTMYLCINYCTNSCEYCLYIDDLSIGTPTTTGEWQTVNANENTADLSELTAGTKYDLTVVPNCDETLASEIEQFTTVSENVKYFLGTESTEWLEAGNWEPTGVPTFNQTVELRANTTITGEATASTISQGDYTITIEDGAKLKHTNTGVVATVKKHINAWTVEGSDTENPNGYYLIANPMTNSVTPSVENGFLVNDYDLYTWNYMNELEWSNFEAAGSSFTYLNSGAYGYLYANNQGTDLTYTGTINAYTSYKYRSASVASNPDNYDFASWYLLGNPYMYDAYLTGASTNGTALPYVKMNADGDGFENVAAGTPIAPMEGFFYQGVTGATSAYVVTYEPTVPNEGKLNMNLRKGNKQLDNAILVFGGNQQLGKMTFRKNSSKVYMPVDGKDLAIASVEGQIGEMPVSFKAEKNGTYTLSFNAQEVSFSYLHLIDNMTGDDVNLLETPSYSFSARTTDYDSRFRLVFATGSSVEGDNFGFINAGGNLCIFGIEGEATVQVVDMLGHVLSSNQFSGSYESKLNVAPGVYMIRLINGNDVKVQKMVVR